VNEAEFEALFTPLETTRPGRILRFLRWLRHWLFSWEDWLTFAIVLMVFFSVVGSINSAHWVEDMPSLYPIALLGLLLGFFLGRLGLREVFTHPIALLLGCAGMLWQVLALIPSGGFKERAGEMVQRMDTWKDALLGGGINSDNLPFIIMVLVLTWLTAYLSSWSIFRWRNPWLGLVPGGLVLLINISYLPGQFNSSFLIFLLGGILLIMRVHFQGRMEEWRRTSTLYPQSLHFSSLFQTLCASLLFLGAAWLIPQARQTSAFESIWQPWAQPVADKVAELSRVFAAIEGKKGLSARNFDQFLPFRGYVGKGEAGELSVEAPEPGFLRGLVYDVYTSSGWKMGDRSRQPLSERADEVTHALELAPEQYQQAVTVKVTVAGDLPVFLTMGQPLAVDAPATEAEMGADPSDVTSLRPEDSLKEGDQYTAVGLASIAPPDVLRNAGSDYPSWVTERYLQLPKKLPSAISELAQELTRFDSRPYDKAISIEYYLRSYPYEIEAPIPPSGRDAVEYFLFEKKEGHALYHASAMVVMLRTLGIPSRLAVGFVLEPKTEDTTNDIYKISGSDAFAWPEVYFPNLGWVEFSPAPTQPPITRTSAGSTSPSGEGPSLQDLLGLEDLSRGATGEPAPAQGTPPQSSEGGGVGGQVMLALLAAAAAALFAALTVGLRRAWNGRTAGLAYPVQVWENTVRLASWAGIGPEPTQTPREYVHDLQNDLPDVPELSFLARSYERTQFGRKPLTEQDRGRLESLWSEIRPRLVRRILRQR